MFSVALGKIGISFLHVSSLKRTKKSKLSKMLHLSRIGSCVGPKTVVMKKKYCLLPECLRDKAKFCFGGCDLCSHFGVIQFVKNLVIVLPGI